MNLPMRAMLCVSLLLLSPEAALSADATQTFDPAPYLRPQQLVDIGGRKLNLYCSGSGSPTVILDANESDDTSDWRFVQPMLARHTRVCSYDRAGFGFSDPGPFPRDAVATASDLRALVDAAHIARPFVLVAYSSSTLPARLYADRYLSDLAALVLVEPDIEDQEPRLFALAPDLRPIFAEGIAAAKACTDATAHHDLTPADKLYDTCAGPDPSLPPSLNAVQAKRAVRHAWWQTYNSDEDSDRTISVTELHREQRSYGALPMSVVTCADPFPKEWPLHADQRQAADVFMTRFLAPLANASSNGSRDVIASCNHGDVLLQSASNVAAAIEKVARISIH